jgi:recombination protein RecR
LSGMRDNQGHGTEIDRLIQLLSKLPGLGPRSARRAVLQLIKRKEALMMPLANALAQAAEHVLPCSECGNLDTIDPCKICQSPRRDRATLCVVEEVGDLWALERAGGYQGLFHVLGGTLSALDGVGPDDLNIAGLIRQTTAHYITDRLVDCDVAVTHLAHGVPVGGELDYLDDGTLMAAMKARRPF